MCKGSAFRGLTWSKRHSKWQAGISLQGRWVTKFKQNSSNLQHAAISPSVSAQPPQSQYTTYTASAWPAATQRCCCCCWFVSLPTGTSTWEHLKMSRLQQRYGTWWQSKQEAQAPRLTSQ
jgi:hypothetical protein